MGRPKGSKNKVKEPWVGAVTKVVIDEAEHAARKADMADVDAEARKGRPQGSKNKVKRIEGPGIRVQLIDAQGDVQDAKFVYLDQTERRERTYVKIGKHMDRQALDVAESLQMQAYLQRDKRRS